MSGESLIKENYHNSKTSDDVRMKLGPVTKLGKRNKGTSKNIDDDVNSVNFLVILIFTIYDQFGAYRKPDFRCLVIFFNSNILPYNQRKTGLKNSSTTFTILFWVKVVLLPFFLQENADISKIKKALMREAIFSETAYVYVLTY